MTTTRDLDTAHDRDTTTPDWYAPPTGELPPFVFVPDAHARDRRPGAGEVRSSVAAEPPSADEAARPRRWSTGHKVAAAVVAVGVLASGGVALAARDGATGAGDVPGVTGGVVPGIGQQPPPGQLPGGQLPGQLGGSFGDDDHDRNGDGSGAPGGLPGTTDSANGTGTSGTTT